MEDHRSWSVLIEHRVFESSASLDAGTFEMLAVEQLLNDEGIPTVFDPFRPGEGYGGGRSFDQPIRLLVGNQDLTRAADLLEQYRAAPVEADGWFDDEDDDEGEDESPPAPEPRPDTFEGWA